MRGNSRLRIAIVLLAPAWRPARFCTLHQPSSKHKPKLTPTPTPIPTPSPTPAPVVKEWNFDQDKPNEIAQGWTAVEGDSVVISESGAPSQPNGFGIQ